MDITRRLAATTLVLAALAFIPGTAQAQGYFSVVGGYSYDGAAGACPSPWSDCPNRPTSWGFGGGSVGKIIGFEAEYSWTSDFFGKGGDVEGSKVTTIMSNFLVGFPIGPVHPYGEAGLGFMKTKIDFRAGTNLASFSDTSWGLNYGFGVIIMLPAHLGFRVDYRRFSSSVEIPYAGPIARDVRTLEFSRATIGVVLH